MKKLLATLGGLLLVLCAYSKGELVISGKVKGDLKGRNKIYITDYTMKDSVTVKDGHFVYHYSIEHPVTLYVYTQFHSEAGIFAFTPLVIDKPGNVEVDYDLDKGYNAVVSGYETTVEFNAFIDRYNPISYTSKPDDPASQAAAREKTIALFKDIIKARPDRFSTAYAINEFGSRLEPAVQQELYNGLGKNAKASEPGVHIKARLEGLKNAAIGNIIPDFSLKDAEGKSFSIRELKGKYVIVDFWASWCAPCRESFPHLKSVYEKYKSKGLEVVSISIDKNREFWIKAMQEENMPWKQLLDDKNIAESGFAVTGIPAMFLLGPDGKVLEKQRGYAPGGGVIDAKLEALFPEKAVSKYIDYDQLQQALEPKVQSLAAQHRFTTIPDLLYQLRSLKDLEKIPVSQPLPAAAGKVMKGRDIYTGCRDGVLMLGKLYNCGSCDQLHAGTLATAVALTADGLCATNYHVLQNVLGAVQTGKYRDSLIYVATPAGEVYSIEKILAFNKDGDVAVFKVNTNGASLHPLALGEPAEVGDVVHAITHPAGYLYYYSTGVVTRNIHVSGAGAPGNRMEISADFARGSSGGPILDDKGNMIGMVASTIPIYYVQDTEKAFQMVIKSTVPVQTIRALLM
ncbi:redoxin domain-containing protein [Chitinophaga arvensicola]|uniref:Thioredoxin domain-containing protein n=1 Tax=Chitinophaga arvensicola TaxID=29529 RepID=A0A1I0RQF3_9BACT|nr:redoxin domain-containing protein [Chitinophaga arvensicola]SEW43525.1 protein of unknown function [Chitinophaga arvensicola]